MTKYTSPYESDASQLVGKATKVEQPKNILELREVVKKNHKICIRGGGSGLAGGAVPQNEVVLDMSKLDKISNLDTGRKTIEIEAGVILDDLNNYLDKYNLELPLNPSSHAICTIGGMIATNAVGSRAIKYGKTSEWVNWVEIINSAGEAEIKTKTELSDYAGLEGTTGVIFRANLRLASKKRQRTATLLSSGYINEISDYVRNLKRNANVSMIEFFDKKISEWLGFEFKYHLLIEYESDEGNLKGESYKKIMETRDKLYPTLAEKGYNRIEDPKVLLDRFDKLFTFLESYDVPVYGHLSMGILHPCFSKSQEKLIPEIMTLTKKLCGQVSGEHGIGLLKKEFVDIADKKIIQNIKSRTDPIKKFNSGKVI
jgi:glycolate oxidase